MSIDRWFVTDSRCPHCGSSLVDVTRQALDTYKPVLMCTYRTCLYPPLHTLVNGQLVVLCPEHNVPVTVCGCILEEPHE